jgi:hypothetical protein
MSFKRNKESKMYRFHHSATVYFIDGDSSPLKVVKREYVDGLPMYRVQARNGFIYYCHEQELFGDAESGAVK